MLSLESGLRRGSRRIATLVLSPAAMLTGMGLMLPVAWRALRSSVGAAPLSDPLALVLHRLPLLFPLHMVASAFALLLVPSAMAAWRVPRFHRWLGRAAAGFILVGGSTSLLVALASAATPAARASFFCEGVAWIACVGAGVVAIRRKQRAWHVRFMIATAILTVSPVVLRLIMHAVLRTQMPVEQIYAIFAWAVWVAPLAIYGLVEWTRAGRRGAAAFGGASRRMALRAADQRVGT